MPNLAQITIAGHLGRDAEIKSIGGSNVCEFSMAVTTKRKGDETTNWYRCALWGARGEKIADYLTKGKAVLVTGRLLARDYTTKEGDPRYSLDVNVSEIEFLGGGGESNEAHASKPADPNPEPDDADIPF